MAHSQPSNDWRTRFWRRIAWLLFAVLALLSLILVLYLGSHSRLYLDDFCHLTTGAEYGPWGNVLFWRNIVNGSFSWYFLHGLAAPLDVLTPSTCVVIIIAAWLVGLVWLIDAGRRLVGLPKPPLAQTFVLAAALVALSINGLLTPQSIYWFSASARHTLPIAVVLIAVAAGCEFALRIRKWGRLPVAIAVFALVSFFNAGMAETVAVLQLALLAALFLLVFTVVPAPSRQRCYAFLISGCAASSAALLLMLSAPGVARRLGMFEAWADLPTRSPSELSLAFLEHLQTFFVNTELNAAFMTMFALSLILHLGREDRRQVQAPPSQKPFQLAAPPLVFCMLVQLALLPLVWTQQSDNPYIVGRFSPSYMFIVAANIVLLLIVAAVLVARNHINTRLRRQPGRWAAIPALTLAVVFLFFCLAHFRGVDWRAKVFVYASVYTLLLGLLWQLHSQLPASIRVRLFATAVMIMLTLGGPVLALVGVNEFIFGTLRYYSMPFVPFVFAIAGFLCGIALASGIKRANETAPADRSTRAILAGSAIVAIAVWLGMIQRNVNTIPIFQNFSQAWDKRHNQVLTHREHGMLLEELPRLEAENPNALGYFGGGVNDYWQSSCASDDITALLEERYRA